MKAASPFTNVALLGLCATLLASCGSVSTVKEQEVKAAPMVNLSTEGRQALDLLRSAAAAPLTENVYLNAVTAVDVPGTLNERSGASSLRWASRWATQNWQAMNNGLVKVNWMRAYALTGPVSAQALRDACLNDGTDAQDCGPSLKTATNAAVEYQKTTGTWLIVLANVDRPLSVSPQH